jgi:Mn-dependent DtxR family transcriptional regulator
MFETEARSMLVLRKRNRQLGETKMATVKKADSEKRSYVSIEDFIRAYEDIRNESISEVAEKLGIKPPAVSLRASKLRKEGVELRKFARGGRPSVVEKAKEILAQIRRGR